MTAVYEYVTYLQCFRVAESVYYMYIDEINIPANIFFVVVIHFLFLARSSYGNYNNLREIAC